MDQNKIDGSTHDDDNDRSLSIEHVPLDLMGEILSRQPAKSIGSSRSVSKLWSSITTTQGFIKSFAARSSESSQPCDLLIFSKRDKLFVFSFPQTESYQFKIPRDGFLQRYDSVHGLVYLETSTQLMIWNPTMKRFFTLPEPEGSEGKYITGSLGYDPIDCKYKALCHLTGDKIGILTLGSQESWRILSQGFPSHSRRMSDCVICINGVIYYQCFSGLSLAHAIMSFDVRSEKFHLIKYMSRDGCFFVSYEGRLALMLSSNGHSGIELWILVNAENHEWVYKHFPTPFLRQTFWVLRDMKLKGVTDEAWKIAQLGEPLEDSDVTTMTQTNQPTGTSSADIWTCQVDGSWSAKEEWMGLGFVLFANEEIILEGQRCCTRAQAPLHAEAESLSWAMKEVTNRGFHRVRFESDCQQLVNIILKEEEWPSMANEIEDIKATATCLQKFELSYISRSLNFRADSLAKGGRSRALRFENVNTLVHQGLAHAAGLNEPV